MNIWEFQIEEEIIMPGIVKVTVFNTTSSLRTRNPRDYAGSGTHDFGATFAHLRDGTVHPLRLADAYPSTGSSKGLLTIDPRTAPDRPLVQNFGLDQTSVDAAYTVDDILNKREISRMDLTIAGVLDALRVKVVTLRFNQREAEGDLMVRSSQSQENLLRNLAGLPGQPFETFHFQHQEEVDGSRLENYRFYGLEQDVRASRIVPTIGGNRVRLFGDILVYPLISLAHRLHKSGIDYRTLADVTLNQYVRDDSLYYVRLRMGDYEINIPASRLTADQSLMRR